MAIINKHFWFEAAHQLVGHKGQCAREHGHSYEVVLDFDSSIQYALGNSDDGFVIDFGDVSQVVKPLIDRYCEHQNLNNTLNVRRTTAELIACWFFGATVWFFEDKLRSVTVKETKSSAATVYEDDWERECGLTPDQAPGKDAAEWLRIELGI